MELRLANVRTLASVKSAFQDIIIFENPTLGIVLVLDGIIQLSEFDEKIYHESLVFPAAAICNTKGTALILGGGDGGAAAACCAANFRSIHLVEIDECVVELCNLYFAEIWKNVNRERVKIHFQDGRDFVRSSGVKFDLIVCDFTDFARNTRTENLYGFSFYNNLKNLLNEGGVLVTQAGAPFVYPLARAKILKNLEKVFANVATVDFPSLTFGTAMGSACIAWGHDVAVNSDLLRRHVKANAMINIELRNSGTTLGHLHDV